MLRQAVTLVWEKRTLTNGEKETVVILNIQMHHVAHKGNKLQAPLLELIAVVGRLAVIVQLASRVWAAHKLSRDCPPLGLQQATASASLGLSTQVGRRSLGRRRRSQSIARCPISTQRRRQRSSPRRRPRSCGRAGGRPHRHRRAVSTHTGNTVAHTADRVVSSLTSPHVSNRRARHACTLQHLLGNGQSVTSRLRVVPH